MHPLRAALIGMLLFATTALAADKAASERRLLATPTTAPIVIDGRLDEEAWTAAPVAADFIQNEPHPDEPASEPTEVRVLYDHDTLYIGVRARDSEPGRLIVSDLKEDFNAATGDSFQLVLDTFHDGRNAYQFAINPAGAKWDAQVTNDGRQINADWDAVWFVKAHIDEEGWTAEIAIPFRALKFRDQDTQVWGVNFQRSVRRRNEDSYWAPLPRIYELTRVSLAGTLDGLQGVRPGANVRIKPYVLGTTLPPAGGDAWSGDAGLDVKYALTPGLSWDFTYNTDFSQVEADNQQINLTRFNLKFPEKREFFLENAGMFQFSGGADEGPRVGIPPDDMLFFHSRLIGLTPDVSATPGVPVPILGGTRLTGRAGAYEMGLLNIEQREGPATPGTNFTVVRVRRDVLRTSDVGLMVNNKEELGSAHYNRVVGIDGNFRFTPVMNLYTYVAKSFAPSGGGTDTMAGRAAFHYISSAWSFRSSYVTIQPDFRNEMGFVPRTGMRKYAGLFGHTFRPVSIRDSIRRIYPHVRTDYLWNPEGRLESQSTDYHFLVELAHGGSTEMGINSFREVLTEPFTINKRRHVVIPPGAYDFHDNLWTGSTDNSRRLFGNAKITAGPFYTGYSRRYTLGATLRFGYRASGSFDYGYNDIDLPQGRFKTTLLTLRGNYSFSTRAFLNALIQYNSDARQWSSNVRFNLIHRPLSDLFVVYNEQRDSTTGTLADRAVVAKLTYMIVR